MHQNFVLMDNDGADAVVGNFSGLAEGATTVIGNRFFTLSYKGGTGNDVVLTSGGSQITGTAGADTVNGSVSAPGQPRATAFHDVISGLGGNDKLYALASNDTLSGGDGNDVLDGGLGADTMTGGAGNETYVVDSAGNKVNETGTGVDAVVSSITFRLVGPQVSGRVENLTLTGTTAINGFGDAFANAIVGNAKTNTLQGLGGNDLLAGGLGKDTLTGGANNDSFFFNTAPSAANIDTITDYNVAADTIRLENAVFTRLAGTGVLTAAQFWKSATGLAHDANDRIIYETDTGKLFYDSNGSAAGGRVELAVLTGHPAITNADFFIV